MSAYSVGHDSEHVRKRRRGRCPDLRYTMLCLRKTQQLESLQHSADSYYMFVMRIRIQYVYHYYYHHYYIVRRTGLEKSAEDVKMAEDSEDVFTKESPEDVKTAEDVKTKTAEID